MTCYEVNNLNDLSCVDLKVGDRVKIGNTYDLYVASIEITAGLDSCLMGEYELVPAEFALDTYPYHATYNQSGFCAMLPSVPSTIRFTKPITTEEIKSTMFDMREEKEITEEERNAFMHLLE